MDATGSVSFRLPANWYTILVTWRGVQVAVVSNLTVPTGGIYFIDATIHDINISVVDAHLQALAGAVVTVKTPAGEVFDTQTTDVGGFVDVRLPAGPYQL